MPLRRFFPYAYERLNAHLDASWLGAARRDLLPGLAGHVLEIGAGTGANLRHLHGAAQVTASEPAAGMRARLRTAAEAAPLPVAVLDAPAEDLAAVPTGSVDAVVSVLVLCSVRDAAAALAEARRVLAPGGVLAVVEHTLGAGPVGRLQHAADPVWSKLAAGCHLNRDTPAHLAAAGFDVGALREYPTSGASRLVAPVLAGVCRVL